LSPVRATLAWAALAVTTGVPVAAAVASPLLEWRDPVYILGGFAGVVAMALLLVQPLLASGLMPGLAAPHWRRVHRWTGAALVLVLLVHVAGLWITSPPDMIDALLFRSPTPFSAWGVIAMLAILATAGLALLRRRLRLSPLAWRRVHGGLAVVIVAGSVAHAMLIEGTMESVSKTALCVLVALATVRALAGLKLSARQP
jgi:predicted ferric reductase